MLININARGPKKLKHYQQRFEQFIQISAGANYIQNSTNAPTVGKYTLVFTKFNMETNYWKYINDVSTPIYLHYFVFWFPKLQFEEYTWFSIEA